MPIYDLSEAKLAANRANSTHSTGPRTQAGKARSSRNSLRHGLRAKDPIALGEDPADYLALHQSFIAEFSPQTPLAHALVEQLTDLQWRLRRIDNLEAAFFDQLIPAVTGIESHPRRDLNALRAAELRNPAALKELDSLSRHYARIKHAFNKTLSQLIDLAGLTGMKTTVASLDRPCEPFPPAEIEPVPETGPNSSAVPRETEIRPHFPDAA